MDFARANDRNIKLEEILVNLKLELSFNVEKILKYKN
jgi:hypothetical protein